MRRTLIATLLCLGLAFASSPARSQAELAAGVAVENIVADVKRGLEELINQAETAYSRQAFDTRMHALVLLQNLDSVASGLVGLTFDRLDASQKKMFEQANAILDKWNAGNQDLAKDFNDLATTLEEATSRLPLADKTPLLKSYSPSYVLQGPSGQSFNVKVSGVRIGTGEPTLKFVTTNCALFSKTDRDIVFKCPAAILGTARAVREQSGVLEVVAPKGFLDWITFSEKRVTYRIGVVGIPAQLGKYRVRATVKTAKVETQDRSQYFEHTNPHCSGNTNLNWPVNASEGWKILEASVRTSPTSVSSGCSGPTAESISSTGFRVTGKAVNSGNCLKVMGKVVSKDGRGWVKGHAYWSEQRTVVADGDVDVTTGTILWGNDAAIQLPSDAKAFVITIERIDGTISAVTGVGSYDRYAVLYNEVSRTVVVRPLSLDKALGG